MVILGLCLYCSILALSITVGRDQRIRMGSRNHPLGSTVQESFYRSTNSLTPARDGPSLAPCYVCAD